MDKTTWYMVQLSPRTFQQSPPDWHILIRGSNAVEVWSSSKYRWTAALKARWIVRRLRKGKYKDKRTGVTFRL